jgi:poly(A) polymerase
MTNLVEEKSMLFAPEEAASILTRLGEFAKERDVECYVVGGFVRDGLLKRVNRDIDVAVAGDALAIAADAAGYLGARMVPLDEAHQVARLVFVSTEQRWHLDFAALRGSIDEDLGCRDFTINAIAADVSGASVGLPQARLIDPLDGRSDLGQKLVRVTGDSVFRDDPARLLRAVRLAAMLDFSIEERTLSLVRRDHDLVATVAGERIRDELCQILETAGAYKALRQMDSLGLLDPLMPELAEARGVTQPKEHFWNVFDHSLETVDAAERLLERGDGGRVDKLAAQAPWSREVSSHFSEEVSGGRTRKSILKLAALLHDLGKPGTRTIEPDGRMRFLGHAAEGASMSEQLLERLRFSNREIRMVRLMIEHHLRPGYLVSEEMPSDRAIYRFFRDTEDVGIDTLYLGLADHLAARGPKLDPDQWRQHAEATTYMLDKYLHEQKTVAPPKLIDGHAIMRRFGLQPGPQIGELLEIVREAQAAGEVNTEEEALALVARSLRKS